MSIPRPLVLVGAGGFARETAVLVEAVNAHHASWELRGFVDDDPSLHGSRVSGVEVLGPVDLVTGLDCAVVVCVGNPGNYGSRSKIVTRLGLEPDRYATLVHPSAVLAASTVVGRGSIVHAVCVATCDVEIGAHVAVMPATVFTHDDVVADFVTVGAGARFAGGVRVETGAYIGAGALVREHRTIGAGSLVGMGSVVTTDVPADQVWAGVPATFRRPAPGTGGRPRRRRVPFRIT